MSSFAKKGPSAAILILRAILMLTIAIGLKYGFLDHPKWYLLAMISLPVVFMENAGAEIKKPMKKDGKSAAKNINEAIEEERAFPSGATATAP